MTALEESDLCLLVIDFLNAIKEQSLVSEKELFDYAMELNKQVLIIYNLFENQNKN